jgi:hypothetical protein
VASSTPSVNVAAAMARGARAEVAPDPDVFRDAPHRGRGESQQVSAWRAEERDGPRRSHRGVQTTPVGPRVDEHTHRAHARNGQQRHVQLDRHGHEDQHALTGAHTALQQPPGNAADTRIQISVLDLPPCAPASGHERGAFRVRCRALLEPRGQVGVHGVHPKSA